MDITLNNREKIHRKFKFSPTVYLKKLNAVFEISIKAHGSFSWTSLHTRLPWNVLNVVWNEYGVLLQSYLSQKIDVCCCSYDLQ